MHSAKKPWWQQATALVTVTTGGVITGFNFVPGAAATMTTPTSVPLHLLALEQAGQPGAAMNARAVGGDSAESATGNALLRSAIVNVAKYYLQMAQTRTPAQMESLIWDNTSLNGADHGPSCAAFASLALELAAQAVGQQSWVSGGTSYPWPEPASVDARVDENPASPHVISLVQDAQAHDRWRPLGDGYQPQAGDFVLFAHHVEVVTSYSGGVLDSIGADSAPNLSVNAHSITGALAEGGVQGFIDNGNLTPASTATGAATGAATRTAKPTTPTAEPAVTPAPTHVSDQAAASPAHEAVIPGVVKPVIAPTSASVGAAGGHAAGVAASIPGAAPAVGDVPHAGLIPGASPTPTATPVPSTTPTPASTPTAAASKPAPKAAPKPAPKSTLKPTQYQHYSAPAQSTPGTRAQQAFINLVAPGAEAAQQRWGVPAAVTLAQAIDESAWGNSSLAADYHNLFGIKGTGPAGSVDLPTSEFYNGQWVHIDAPFRVYHNVAESVSDHAELLATSGYYTRAMADRAFPDAFANDLTGVYATDPDYGSTIISIMKLYNLYRFDTGTATGTGLGSGTGQTSATAQPTPTASAQPTASAHPAASPTPTATHPATPSHARSDQATAASQARIPGLTTPALAPTATVPTNTAPTNTVPKTTRPTTTRPSRGGRVRATTGANAVIPGLSATSASRPSATSASPAPATAAIPGLTATSRPSTASTNTASTTSAPTTTAVTTALITPGTANFQPHPAAVAARYQPELPPTMTNAYFAAAKGPLAHNEPLYRDVAAQADVSWKLLAACDWMQCKAHPRYSPVHGEKLGAVNSDGTSYRTKSAALAQCASDLVELAGAVYGIDLTARRPLSVRALADVFAAFRWGALLRKHQVSAMEFPYAVAGLTAQHLKMHWPLIDDPAAPDRPGAKFREPFGAVPVVLSLDYPATV